MWPDLTFPMVPHEEQKAKFEKVDKVRKELGLPVATLIDTKGPGNQTSGF